ncbi:glutamine synthetase family protein [Halovivax sp.]|uniref:glutamine synthetase family protein n=1 Tax=Halovivax sp. TaxID=1935978 RepID=UPI0031B7F5C5
MTAADTGDSEAVEGMVEAVAGDDVEHVFVEFADINGISRSKQLRADRFLEKWEEGFPMNLLVLVQTPRNDVPEGSGLGEEIGYGDGTLRPLPETFRRLPWRDDAARVRCVLEREGEPLGAAPRNALERVLGGVPRDVSFTVGSELEFYLLADGKAGYEPITDHKHECLSWATEEVSGYFDDLSTWSDGYGVSVDSLMHEHGPGQLEVLFDYGGPLDQADATFDFKRLVKQTAREHDFWATFMAKPFAGESGSGYHLHVGGLEGGGGNAFGADGELSPFGRRFVGGLLEHADALAALGTPNLNAFKRYESGSFAPYTASWGYDNRMAAVRVPSGTTRIENRIASADANPYLVIASTLAAGLHGVEAELEPGDPAEGDPAGDSPTLPNAPELALEALESDDELVSRLGTDLVRAYCATKRAELDAFRDVVTDWEREQYVRTL